MGSIGEFLKKQGWFSILSAMGLGILGIILIMKPEGSLSFVSNILGGMLVIAGIYRIISHSINKSKNDFFDNEIATGIITCITGIIIIVFNKELESIFRIIIGVGVIYKSIINIDISFKLKNIDSKIWLISFMIGIIMLACGLYIVFTPSALIVTMGIILLANAIIDIIDNVLFINDIKQISKISEEIL